MNQRKRIFVSALMGMALVVSAQIMVNKVVVHHANGGTTRYEMGPGSGVKVHDNGEGEWQHSITDVTGTEVSHDAADVEKVSFVTEFHDYTLDDVWAAYEGFHNACYDPNKRIYKRSTNTERAIDRWGGAAAIWCQPMYLDMALNAYLLAKAKGDTELEAKYKARAIDIHDGNKAHYVNFNYDDCNTNTGWFIYDDIQWWTITLARAYLTLGNPDYLKESQAAYARVWYGSPAVGDTGSYADPAKGHYEGGMFWAWSPIEKPNANAPGDAKMACINFPTVCAAMTLYEAMDAAVEADPNPETWANKYGYGDFVRPHYETKARYLEMAKEIFEFGVAHLYRRGSVADSTRGADFSCDWTRHVYNQATFIGGAMLLYKHTGEQRYLDYAVEAMDVVVNVLSRSHKLLPWESGIEQGIYTTILAQYLEMLVNEGGQEQYREFIERNINSGWAYRDASRNVCGGKYWETVIPGSDVDSYSASGIPALMLMFPPLEK